MNFYLQRLQDDIAAAIAGLTDEQFAWHPDGKWSSAEILEHLYLTYTGTIKGFERCLAAGKPLARPCTIKDHLQTTVVVRCGYMPGGRKAPPQATPRGTPCAKLRSEVLPRIAEMDSLIERAVRAYGVHARLLDHPIIGPLRGPEWCKFHWVHGHHHVQQIVHLRQSFAPSRA